MSTRVKGAIGLLAFLALVGFQGYIAYQASPRLGEMLVEYNRTHPMSWVDFGLGALITFFTLMVVFIGLTLRETKRFENEAGGGGNTGGSGGGAPKRVRLPMSRKVIDIRTWQPPAGGQYHRSSAPAPTAA